MKYLLCLVMLLVPIAAGAEDVQPVRQLTLDASPVRLVVSDSVIIEVQKWTVSDPGYISFGGEKVPASLREYITIYKYERVIEEIIPDGFLIPEKRIRWNKTEIPQVEYRNNGYWGNGQLLTVPN